MVNLWLTVFIAIIGICFGSFLNVLIWRLNVSGTPKFWQGRSLCPRCRHTLFWLDNIPLLSFIFLGGKCRYCKKKISLQYPLVEFFTALIFAIIFTMLPGRNPVEIAGVMAIALMFELIFFSDLIYGFVPDLPVIVIVVVSLLINLNNWPVVLVSGAVAASFFFLVRLGANYFAKKEAMGVGDITLALAMGTALGWPRILIAVWSGFIVGGVTALVLVGLKKAKLSATIPLGPFLIIGTIISVLWTDKIIQFLGL